MLKLKFILWPPDAKNWFLGKDPNTGKDWKQEEKGMTVYEMVGWHNGLYGHEFEEAPGVGDQQGSLGSCRLWVHKKLDMTEWLKWTEPASWEICMQIRKQQLESCRELFKIRKGVHQRWYISSCLFNLYANCIMWNVGLDESQECREIYQQPQILRWHHPSYR